VSKDKKWKEKKRKENKLLESESNPASKKILSKEEK